MAIKTVEKLAIDVAKMTFQEISRDNSLKNAVSKALAAAHNKDQFDFFNDKGSPEQKYAKYIEKGNDINISAKLAEKCTKAKDDPKELKKLMNGEVTDEVTRLFQTNLRPCLVASVAFKTWVIEQNKKEVAASAKKAAKLLGIKDEADLAEAMVAMGMGNKAEAKKILEKIEKAEKLKDLYAALEKTGLT